MPRKVRPPVSARSGRYQKKHAEIIEVAARVFAEQGYGRTTIDDICDAANLGKGGLYHYIVSKEHLLVAIQDRYMTPLLQHTETIKNLDLSVPTRLRLISELILRMHFSHFNDVKVILRDYFLLSEDGLQIFRAKRREYEAMISELIEEGNAAGTLRVEDVSVTKLAFLGMHNSTQQWLDPKGSLGPERLASLYCRIFFSGIAADGTDFEQVDAEASSWAKTLRLSEMGSRDAVDEARGVAAGEPQPVG